MQEPSTVERTERWIYEHKGATVALLALILISIGAIMGLAVATNVYDSGMTELFEKASATGLPAEVNGHLYLINETSPRYFNNTNVIIYKTADQWNMR